MYHARDPDKGHKARKRRTKSKCITPESRVWFELMISKPCLASSDKPWFTHHAEDPRQRGKFGRMFMRGIDLFSLLPLLALAVLCDAFSPPTILMIKGGCIRPQGRAWTRGSGGRVAESISMQDGEEKGAKDFSAGKGKGGITRRDAVLGFGLSFVPAVSSTEKYQRISTKRIPLATAQCHRT